MNYTYKNYLYIYNIMLIKENTSLIEKKIIFKKLFLLTQPNIYIFF